MTKLIQSRSRPSLMGPNTRAIAPSLIKSAVYHLTVISASPDKEAHTGMGSRLLCILMVRTKLLCCLLFRKKKKIITRCVASLIFEENYPNIKVTLQLMTVTLSGIKVGHCVTYFYTRMGHSHIKHFM